MSTGRAELLTVLYAGADDDWPDYARALPAAFEALGLPARLLREADPRTVDYVVYAPSGGLRDFTPFTRAKAVLSLWAGVESIVANPTLTQPLVRMVDAGLTQGMIDYVAGHVLRHHLGLDAHLGRSDGIWRADLVPPLASQRAVGVLGLGALGAAAARALAGLGFDVAGWSRRPREIPGIACHAGADGLAAVLARSEILVALLPATPATERLIDAAALARLPAGAVLINPGRGMLIDDDALLAALDRGQVAHATLDVFREEPLPPAHPFWAHPRVTVTPHIASATRPATAAQSIARSIAEVEAGGPVSHLVDRSEGY